MSLSLDTARTALLLVDLQNDFLHADGAYARGGAISEAARAVPGRLAPLRARAAGAGVFTIATQFTLVPGRGGEPLISAHLARLRPFLRAGDFVPGSFGHAVMAALEPVDCHVEKVAFSAFYMSRLEHVLRRLQVTTLLIGGIVTNGGVASTVRDAHVRDLECIVLEDGCAAFDASVHDAAIRDLSSVARIARIGEALAALGAQ